MYRTVFAAALAVAFVVPAAAADTPQGESPQSDKEKVICRREVVTGSIFPKKICRTKAQWEAAEAQGRSDLDRIRDQERSKSMVGGT
jgi:hypothetical protein